MYAVLERKHPQLPPTTDNESIQQHEETQDELGTRLTRLPLFGQN